MKRLPSAEELERAYREFSHFTFDLLCKASKDDRYFKFAAVNAQVSLELFLKYVFTTEGRIQEIQKKKNGAPIDDFVDFSQILNHAFNVKIVEGIRKGDLEWLLAARNSIVHRGQNLNVEQELAEIISCCFLLIHTISSARFDQSLLSQSMGIHPISQNEAWIAGVEKFVANLAGRFSLAPVNCIHCGNNSLVSGKVVTLDDSQNEEDVVCLCCLNSMNTVYDINLLDCPSCKRQSYFVDILNPQEKQWFVGGCSECDNREWLRKCKQCEDLYFPSQVKEVSGDDVFFCSNNCKEYHYEEISNR